MHPPPYPIPWKTLWKLVAAVLLQHRLSYRDEAQASTAQLQPPLRVYGRELLPEQGPYLLTVNHYTRPGLPAWWHTLAVSAQVSSEVHWVITAAWTFPGKMYARVVKRASRLVFQRVAAVFGFTTMPPMPPDPAEAAERAQAVRAVIDLVRRNPAAIIGLSPEGQDFPGGVLGWPPPGAGRFMLLLAKAGLPVAPVGVYEEEGALCVRCGLPYRLDAPPGASADERDDYAREQVMRAIAQLLPASLRGPFG